MKTIKLVLLVLLIVAIAGTVARMVIIRQRNHELAVAERAASQKAARAAELERLSRPPSQPQRAPEPAAVPQPSAETPPAPEPVKTNQLVALPPAPAPAAPPIPPAGGREVRQDPLARAALSLVGVDPYAEAYWLEAIYDTRLSDQEREDLMEDLNEEGLSNPRQPAPEDFPLIANRLRILEDLIPTVSDPFMLEHIGEAYKDLLLLYAGEPAR